jgi:hypothetical protein
METRALRALPVLWGQVRRENVGKPVVRVAANSGSFGHLKILCTLLETDCHRWS